MSRRVGLLLLLVVVLLVGGAAAVVLSTRPDLMDARDRVDARWVPLRAPLATRYDQLTDLATALAAAGAADRTYTVDLRDGLADWGALTKAAEPDPEAEVDAANRLEGLAARVRADVAASARLRADAGIAAALSGFDAALVDPPAILRYNRAVRAYQDTRDGTVHHAVAQMLGYDSRAVLVVGLGTPAR